MRSLLLCCFVAAAAPACASAQDFTPVADRIISDPTYLPLKGQAYGETGYGYSETDGSLFDSTGANIAHSGNTLSDVTQRLDYGITDALSVRASIGYGWGSDHRATALGTTDTDRDGFENPTFGATYRILDQRSHPVSLDVYADWAPDVFPARTASLTQSGTVATGGPQAALGFAVGRETRMFTIRGAFTDRYVGATSIFNRDTGLAVSSPSFWIPTLGVQTQTRLTPRLSVNAGYGYNFQGRTLDEETARGVPFTDRIGDTQDVNVAVNYHIVPDRLVGSVGYQHTFVGDRQEVFADPTSNELQTRGADLVNVTLRYLFR